MLWLMKLLSGNSRNRVRIQRAFELNHVDGNLMEDDSDEREHSTERFRISKRGRIHRVRAPENGSNPTKAVRDKLWPWISP